MPRSGHAAGRLASDDEVMRRLALLGALSVLAISGGGCAGSEPTAPLPALQSFGAVASATRAATTGRFELNISMSMGDTKLAVTGVGAFDRASDAMEMTLDLSSFAKTLGTLGRGTPGLDGVEDPDNWKLDAVQQGKVVYLRLPLLASRMNGAHWLTLDPAALAGASSSSLGQFGSFGASDPRAVLDSLKAVSGSIEPVGRDEVRGVETSHYVAMLDPGKLAAQATRAGASADIVSRFTSSFSQLGLGVLPLHVWIDDQNLVRKLTMDVSPSETSIAAGIKVMIGFELFDYGAPVSIVAPPSADTVAASQVAGFLGR
jgi:hypothetical protein